MESITLVLTDDHPIVRCSVATKMHGTPDVRVIGEAGDGHEALHLVRELQPDVLLLDIKMPRLSGIETAGHLRAARSPVKILVFSAYADPGRVHPMLDHHVEGYLVKDEPLAGLLEAIRGVARGGRGYYSRAVKECLLCGGPWEHQAPADLTNREQEVLQLIMAGKTNSAVSHALFISEKTVEKHLHAIYRKLQVSSRTEAAVAAARSGLSR